MTAPRTVPALEVRFPDLSRRGDLPDLVSLVLDDFLPLTVHEDGPEEAPVWRVYLPSRNAAERVSGILATQFGHDGLGVRVVDVPDEDWAARSQAHLTRVTVGGITVAPPWDVPDAPDGGGAVIVVRPSTGFGTGHHETTRLCLALLQDLPLEGRRVLDVGTGSGILALAAATLGAADAEGLDADEDALQNAWDNRALNGRASAVTFTAGDFCTVPVAPADVVLANLSGALLTAGADRLTGLVREGGSLIVSGFLAPEARQVHEAYGRALRLRATVSEGDWHAALFSRVGGTAG